MSKKNQQFTYRLCLKSGTFKEQKPSFVIKAGKFEKKINTYFIASDKQRYNYDLLLQKSPDTDIMVHCDVGDDLLGTAILKVDSRKTQQPNQSLSVMNSKKQKIALIQCSLKKLDKKSKKSPIRIQVIQASFNLNQQKKTQKSQSFVVLKYGDANYQTKITQNTIDQAPVWKENFQSGQSFADRIFVEVWRDVSEKKVFEGLALVDVAKGMGQEKDYDVMFDKKKKGSIKLGIYPDNQTKCNPQQQQELRLNDKNYIRKRTIKAYITQTLLKDPSKKGSFIRLVSSESQQKFQTSHSFQSTKEIGFNESFTMVVKQNEQIQAYLMINEEMQEEIARTSIRVEDIVNKKYQLKLLDGRDSQIGTLYMEFYDQELDIQEEINNQSMIKPVSDPSKEKQKEQSDTKQQPLENKQSKTSMVSDKTASKLSQNAAEIKARYATRQPIHDYMNEVNAVLQQGLLKIAKQRPQNPIKELGLYLINYKK